MSEPDRITQMIGDAAESAALRFIEEFEGVRANCESPIEELLLAALFIYDKEVGQPKQMFFMQKGGPQGGPPFDETVFVYQQAQVGPYRVDFLILDASLPFELGEPRWLVIECDGHDFHERTKEQARRDKRRDRFLQLKGYRVLRFTGSEIWADAEKCADEIIKHLACFDDRGRA